MPNQLKKNDRIPLKITGVTAEGSGVGHDNGLAVFVANAALGDTVTAHIIKVKKNYAVARIHQIVTPSPDRVKPDCPVFQQCGGCAWRHITYEAECRLKEKTVADALSRIGHLTITPQPILAAGETDGYRNKAQFPVGEDKDGNIVIGFYAGRTHHIVEQTDCCIGAPENGEVLRKVKAYMQKNQIRPYNEEHHSGIVRHILIRTGYHTKEIMVCLIVNAAKASCLKNAEQLTESLREMDGMTSVMVNFNTEKTNVILGKKSEVLWGQPYIEDFIGDVKYQISPQSFFQVNPMQTE